jgi:hypothetical protein
MNCNSNRGFFEVQNAELLPLRGTRDPFELQKDPLRKIRSGFKG